MMNENQSCYGQDPNSSFAGYGDESIFGASFVYSLVIIPKVNRTNLLNRISEIKWKYKIPPTERLHCRKLFNARAREASLFSHLTSSDAKRIVSAVFYEAKRADAVARIAYAFRPQGPTLFDGRGPEQGLPNADKTIIGVVANAAFIIPPNNKVGIKPLDAEFFVDQDATRIDWLAGQRTRAHRNYKSTSHGVYNASEELTSIVPYVSDGETEPLLQVADVFAYVSAHACEENRTFQRGWFWKKIDLFPHSWAEVPL